jgi:hypothetical protein
MTRQGEKMFDDLTKDIKAQLYERARSPLTGTFIFSWIGWNFRPISIYFSSFTYDEKVAHWNAFYSGNYEPYLSGFVFPFLTSALFIFLYPFPAKWAYHYWHWQHMKIKKIQQQIEDVTPLTQEEANELRKKSIQELTKMQQELRLSSSGNAELTNQNRALMEELALSKSKIDKLERDLAASKNIIPASGGRHLVGNPIVPNTPDGLSNLEAEILGALGQYENNGQDWIDQNLLLRQITPDDITAGKIALQELQDKNLGISSNGKFMLTHEGRLALKDSQ